MRTYWLVPAIVACGLGLTAVDRESGLSVWFTLRADLESSRQRIETLVDETEVAPKSRPWSRIRSRSSGRSGKSSSWPDRARRSCDFPAVAPPAGSETRPNPFPSRTVERPTHHRARRAHVISEPKQSAE